jgi:hypothetical protein
VQWAKNYGGSSTDQGNDLVQHGMNYVIVGETRNFSKGLEDVFLIKTDSLGNNSCQQDSAFAFRAILPLFQGTGGLENSGNTTRSGIIALSNPDTSSYNPCVCVPPIANFQIEMFNTCGIFFDYSTWATTWYWDFGDGDISTLEIPDHCWDIGIYYVCLTVTNECGTDTYCETVEAILDNTNEVKISLKKLFIAPNPLTNFTTVKFDNEKKEKLKLELLNPLGQTLLQLDNITDNKIQIEKNGLQSGLYLIKLMNGNQIVGADKIIIR